MADNKKKITSVFTKESAESAERIKEILRTEGKVEVVNQYETFYGVGFDRWFREQLKDIDCTIEVTGYNKWYGYPWEYIVTMN